MATSNMKTPNNELMTSMQLGVDRGIFLMNCELGGATPNEKLAADYINELKTEIEQLYERINRGKS